MHTVILYTPDQPDLGWQDLSQLPPDITHRMTQKHRLRRDAQPSP